MPKVVCLVCESEFNKPQCHINRVKKIFCSVTCHNLFQSRMSVKKICKLCGDEFVISPVFQKRYSTCSKEECRASNKSAENNPNWRGGVTSLRKRDMSTTKYKEWRLSVFVRDNYTCVFCAQRGGDLNADHIKPWAYFPDLRYDVDNGRTLCLGCHKKTYKDVFTWRGKVSSPKSIPTEGNPLQSNSRNAGVGIV